MMARIAAPPAGNRCRALAAARLLSILLLLTALGV